MGSVESFSQEMEEEEEETHWTLYFYDSPQSLVMRRRIRVDWWMDEDILFHQIQTDLAWIVND